MNRRQNFGNFHLILFIDEIVMNLIPTLNTSRLLCKNNVVYFLRNFCFRFVYCLCVIRWFSHSENLDTVLVDFANNHVVDWVYSVIFDSLTIKIDTVVVGHLKRTLSRIQVFFSSKCCVLWQKWVTFRVCFWPAYTILICFFFALKT